MTQWGVDTLFNPAKRHMDEEKRRLQSTRQEVGDNSGGKRIDLESGKVRISRKPAEDAEDPEGAEEAEDAPTAETVTAETGTGDDDTAATDDTGATATAGDDQPA